MRIFRVNKAWLLDVLGMGSESLEEVQVETINVRLEEMFREIVQDVPNVIHLHRDELRKLQRFAPTWTQDTLYTTELFFDRREGLPDSIVTALNQGPAALAQRLVRDGRLAFCHAPVLRFINAPQTIQLQLMMGVAYASSSEECKHESKPPQLPQPDGGDQPRRLPHYSADAPSGALADNLKSFGDFAGRDVGQHDPEVSFDLGDIE